MNQKIKYYSLLFTLMVLGLIYYQDINLVKDKVKNVVSDAFEGETVYVKWNELRDKFLDIVKDAGISHMYSKRNSTLIIFQLLNLVFCALKKGCAILGS